MAPAIAIPSEVVEATRTLPQAITKILTARQETTTIITSGGSSSSGSNLSGGAIAGIVIGSIAGLLLLWWIIRSCSNMGRPATWGNTYEPEREKPPPRMSTYHADTPYRHETHGRRSHHSHRHHSRSHSRSPRPVEIVQPVVYDPRGRSPRAPPAAYYAGRSSSDRRRRSSDARSHRYQN
ncbi:hypothetical protein E0Z10_g6081 [Xylaria hypoxylon]|uniref:Uncharacterized protein n=1 Tax=Xylaria hypoxylon TaxID=37992 RepID=A0A4Z0YF52_9PEZI|nr:hypothetical protein E0Z10_g6081 [Xylaria hypoxylon]